MLCALALLLGTQLTGTDSPRNPPATTEVGHSNCMLVPPVPPEKPIRIGWHDDLNRIRNWRPLGIMNQAKASAPRYGALRLTLGHVPADWPYTYQWSGVTREATVDVGKFPLLEAKVSDLHGYAHLDIDVLDASGAVIKGFRASTLQSPGLTQVDLGKVLDPAVYHLRIRMIVGGPIEGCSATYDWIRAASGPS